MFRVIFVDVLLEVMSKERFFAFFSINIFFPVRIPKEEE